MPLLLPCLELTIKVLFFCGDLLFFFFFFALGCISKHAMAG